MELDKIDFTVSTSDNTFLVFHTFTQIITIYSVSETVDSQQTDDKFGFLFDVCNVHTPWRKITHCCLMPTAALWCVIVMCHASLFCKRHLHVLSVIFKVQTQCQQKQNLILSKSLSLLSGTESGVWVETWRVRMFPSWLQFQV